MQMDDCGAVISFIGTVRDTNNDGRAVVALQIEPADENADVKLVNLSTNVGTQTKTDNYGDFEFEGLETNGRYSVLIEKVGYQPVKMDAVHTERDVFLGEILLTQESKG